jgi:hypothetical protein
MRLLDAITKPLRRAYAVVFREHVSLVVQKQGVRVVLRERPMVPAEGRPPSAAEIAARREREKFALMQQQLAELLDDLPETRETLRHLVFVEQALAKKGLRALDRLPVDVLRRALEQLEGLVVNWSPVGLATLRSRIAVALIERDSSPKSLVAEAEDSKVAPGLDAVPDDAFESGLEVSAAEDALVAAYAALGNLAPVASPGLARPAAPVRLAEDEVRVHVLSS